MRHPLRNYFAAQDYPLRNRGFATKKAFLYEIISQPKPHPMRKFLQLRNAPLAHECHFAAQTTILQLQNGCEILQSFISQPKYPLRNTSLAHECHFAAPHPHFAAVKWAAKMPLGCEIVSWLRNKPSSAKISTVTQIPI